MRKNGERFMHLKLRNSAKSWQQFAYNSKFDLHVVFPELSLQTTLFVTNTDAEAFDFTLALHTYLST